MIEKVPIKVRRIKDEFSDIPLPEYSTKGSSGLDIRAAVDEALILSHGEVKLVPTNLSVEIPEDYEIQVRPRSGLAAKYGIGILNSPGTIDADYRGEIKVILINLSDKDFVINDGERIAQIIVSKHERVIWTEAEQLEETLRGEGGFGHTGKK